MPHPPRASTPTTTMLRQRAAHLHDLARRIEESQALQLGSTHSCDAPTALAGRLLERNVLQLGLAVVELRETATRLRRHADSLDDAAMVASTAVTR